MSDHLRHLILQGPYDELKRAPKIEPREDADEPPGLSEPQIDPDDWNRHALLLAQTGGGKTNVLRWRIQQLLPDIARGQASLILMEPKGDLTREALGIVHERGLHDRLIYLDPGDPSIAVNLFDTSDLSAQGVNAAVNRISRIFATITSDVTPFQRNVLIYSLRALFTLPKPRTMDTLFHIVRSGIDGLPVNVTPRVRSFFDDDFRANKARAAELIGRLNNLLSDPVFEALFDTEETTFDMLDALQAGRIIIINAGAADSLYGRFWIEEIDRINQARIQLEDAIVPATFIIDEAHVWVGKDTHFARILDMARGAKIGMFIALQHLGQIRDDHVRNSILTNAAIKFVAKTSADIHNLCRSLGNVETSFITTLNDFEFAFFGPNMQRAEVVKFPLVTFPRAPKLRTRDPLPPAPEEEAVVEKTTNFETLPYDLEPRKPKPQRPRPGQKPAEPPTPKVEPEQRRDTEGGTGWS